MKKHLFTLLAILSIVPVMGQTDERGNYRRNALATMLLYHPEDEFGINIYEAFDSIPMPDKYDNHNLDYRIIINDSVRGAKRNGYSGMHKARYGKVLTPSEMRQNGKAVERMLNESQFGKLVIAKWFGLSGDTPENARFNTKLVQERGQYNASDVDVAKAMLTARGVATLSDAGEDLIGHSFILVNDITYVTAEEEAYAAKMTLNIIGILFDSFAGGNAGRQLADASGKIADSFTGFNVKTHSYLYRLVWNDSIATEFYNKYYTDKPNPEKMRAFVADTSLFKMRYVAHEYEWNKKSVLKGQYDRRELVKTVCARSIDKNIAALQRKYPLFKVKTPIYAVEDTPGGQVIQAKIGMKEGVTDRSHFQVLLPELNPETQQTRYRYVGSAKPIKQQIWDNRYNAVIENPQNANLAYTRLKKTSGGEISPGMLLVEGYSTAEMRSYLQKDSTANYYNPEDNWLSLLSGNNDNWVNPIDKSTPMKFNRQPSDNRWVGINIGVGCCQTPFNYLSDNAAGLRIEGIFQPELIYGIAPKTGLCMDIYSKSSQNYSNLTLTIPVQIAYRYEFRKHISLQLYTGPQLGYRYEHHAKGNWGPSKSQHSFAMIWELGTAVQWDCLRFGYSFGFGKRYVQPCMFTIGYMINNRSIRLPDRQWLNK